MTEILNGEEILLKLRNFFQQMHSSTTELNHIPILNKFFLGNFTSLLVPTYDSLTLYTFISVCIFSILNSHGVDKRNLFNNQELL